MMAVLALWTGARVATMQPLIPPARTAGAIIPGTSLIQAAAPPRKVTGAAYHGRITRLADAPSASLDHVPIVRVYQAGIIPVGERRSFALAAAAPVAAAAQPFAVAEAGRGAPITLPPVSPPPRGPSEPEERWSGSAWLFWRQHSGTQSLGGAGQLGGAQAGLRIERALGGGRSLPFSAYARVTAALSRPAAPEAAVGIAVRPRSGRVPVTLGIERRIALSGEARNAFALLAVSGLAPTHLTRNLIAEGYVQAGAVGLSRTDPFVDGRFSLTTAVDRREETRIGFSLSGGAQPAVSRLDAGPVFETRLPVGTVRPRLVVEWRQRVAGSARPDSGLSVTLASDF